MVPVGVLGGEQGRDAGESCSTNEAGTGELMDRSRRAG